jgi:DNA-binding NtrC family response regulator
VSPPPRILIADDQPDVLEALRLLLKGEGFVVETVTAPAAVLRAAEAHEFDAVLIDLNYTRDTTSGREGLGLLAKLQALDPSLPVVVMTAWGSVESAVEAMRLGARDYVEKPWDNARLLATLQSQVELARALRTTGRLAAENRRLRGGEGRPQLVAESRAMQPVLRQLERVAPSDANVLITGEHGTGKDVVARWIHSASRRANRPLVTVNAGGIAETLFESELFGHVKGAFTDAKTDRAGCFELADGGTLFLDEIANVSLKQQAKLLRVLESGELQRVGSSRTRQVDVRVVSATNAELPREVSEGRFREDLLYRLNTVEIRLPPLRERREDVPLLAAHFLREAGGAIQQAGGGAEPRGDACAARPPVAGQRARAAPRRGARRAHGTGGAGDRRGPRASGAARRRRALVRRADARGRGAAAHPAGPRAARGEREPRRRGARREPQRALPAAAALRAVAEREPGGDDLAASGVPFPAFRVRFSALGSGAQESSSARRSRRSAKRSSELWALGCGQEPRAESCQPRAVSREPIAHSP